MAVHAGVGRLRGLPTAPSTSARAGGSAPASRTVPPWRRPRAPTSLATRPPACSPPPSGWRCSPSATAHDSGRRARTSGGSPSPTASTPPPTRRPGSTSSRSPSRTTRSRAGSSSLCTCSTAARRSDGAQALVVVSTERARDLPQPPVIIERGRPGSGRAAGEHDQLLPGDDRRPAGDRGSSPVSSGHHGARARRHPGGDLLRPLHAVRALPQLEEFGFCGKGEAKDFIRDGHDQARWAPADQHERWAAR